MLGDVTNLQARRGVIFIQTYNESWLPAKLNYRSPMEAWRLVQPSIRLLDSRRQPLLAKCRPADGLSISRDSAPGGFNIYKPSRGGDASHGLLTSKADFVQIEGASGIKCLGM